MVIAAMWASSRMENGIAGLFNTPGLLPETVEVATPAPVAAPVPAPDDVAAATPAPSAEPTTPTPQPIVTSIPGTVLSPTGVWQRAPRMAEQAQSGTLDGLVTFAALPQTQAIPKPYGPSTAIALPDPMILAPANPRPANRPMPRDARGFILDLAHGRLDLRAQPRRDPAHAPHSRNHSSRRSGPTNRRTCGNTRRAPRR